MLFKALDRTLQKHKNHYSYNFGMRAHHYTSQSNFFLFGIENQGLRPTKVLETMDPYVFAFMEEQPNSWKNSREFPEVWQRVLKHILGGDVALVRCSFDVQEALVADWAHIERARKFMGCGRTTIPSKRDMIKYRRAVERYAASLVRLEEYEGHHTLPELLIETPISRERLTCELVDHDDFEVMYTYK